MCIAAWQWGGRPHAGLDSPDGREVAPPRPGGDAAARGAWARVECTTLAPALPPTAIDHRVARD